MNKEDCSTTLQLLTWKIFAQKQLSTEKYYKNVKTVWYHKYD